MIEINPQPEPNPISELGFTREDFTTYLREVGFLKESDSVSRWEINDRDFFAFDVKKKS